MKNLSRKLNNGNLEHGCEIYRQKTKIQPTYAFARKALMQESQRMQQNAVYRKPIKKPGNQFISAYFLG